jgi:prefoldin subunit 5
MEKIRKGNDIEVQWAIYVGAGINEVPYDLTGKKLSLFLRNQFGRTEVYDYTIDKHVIRFMFWGKDQTQTGTYSIELVENEGRQGMHTVDECDAFQLVNHSCQTGGDSEGRVECIHLQFRANMGISVPAIGGGMEIEVDDKLSLESVNPVQNKVITLALQEETERATASELKLEQSISDYDSKLELIEDSLSVTKDTVQNLMTKIENVDDRLAKIDEALKNVDIEEVANVLTKVETLESDIKSIERDVVRIEENVEELEEKIDTLNADAQTVGSVESKINSALDWETINQ